MIAYFAQSRARRGDRCCPCGRASRCGGRASRHGRALPPRIRAYPSASSHSHSGRDSMCLEDRSRSAAISGGGGGGGGGGRRKAKWIRRHCAGCCQWRSCWRDWRSSCCSDSNAVFSFDMLARHKATLTAWVASTSSPGGSSLSCWPIRSWSPSRCLSPLLATPVGGFLFGTWRGAVPVGDRRDRWVRSPCSWPRASPSAISSAPAPARRLARLEGGFQHNDFSYLLFLRLVPVFPSG